MIPYSKDNLRNKLLAYLDRESTKVYQRLNEIKRNVELLKNLTDNITKQSLATEITKDYVVLYLEVQKLKPLFKCVITHETMATSIEKYMNEAVRQAGELIKAYPFEQILIGTFDDDRTWVDITITPDN